MKRDCLSCGQGEMVHAVRDVPYTYKGHHRVIEKVRGWHCSHCTEVEFDAGEGVRFAEAIKQIAKEIDARDAAELVRIRKKLKLTQQEAALLTGGGPNAFSRYEHGKAKPVQAVSNLFKLLDRHPDLLKELKSA
jgi:HTH-type transcriptional regulator / antitoxin MqsA